MSVVASYFRQFNLVDLLPAGVTMVVNGVITFLAPIFPAKRWGK